MTHESQKNVRSTESSRLRILSLCAVIFVTGVGVRLLHWQDNRIPIFAAGMAEEYKANARLLVNGEISSFVRGSSSPQDTNILAHPPGYPLLMWLVFKTFGASDAAMRVVNIVCDVTAAILIFFIARQFLQTGVAMIAALLVALSPQLAFHSIILLPESPAVLPILLAVYLIIRASKKPSLLTIMAAGACIGLSCWLRANGLLLAPFLIVLIPVLFERGRRVRYALALTFAALIVIAPVTIRNAAVFHRFIPLSLGAGITMVEGIADYDKEKKFGLPTTDRGVIRMESELYNRPDYRDGLFYPDGIERERTRTARSLAVIRANPWWFFGVMLRRATMMLRHERVDIVWAEPSVTHSLDTADKLQPVWSKPMANWSVNDIAAVSQSKVSLALEDQKLRLVDEEAGDAQQIASLPVDVQQNTDYVLKVPVKIEDGSLIIKIISDDKNASLASTNIIQPESEFTIKDQPTLLVRAPFVTRDTNRVRVVLSDGKAKSKRIVARIGSLELFELGTASALWTRYPRSLVQGVQKFFLTAWMLPFAVLGIVLLLINRLGRVVVTLLAVPVYYLCFQSILHTEYRYVVAIHYFLYILVAVALYWLGGILWRMARKLTKRVRLTDKSADGFALRCF